MVVTKVANHSVNSAGSCSGHLRDDQSSLGVVNGGSPGLDQLASELYRLLDMGATLHDRNKLDSRVLLENTAWSIINQTLGCSSINQLYSHTPREIESFVDSPTERKLAADALVAVALLEPQVATRCSARALFLDETNVAASIMYIVSTADRPAPALDSSPVNENSNEHSRSSVSRWKLAERALERLINDRLDSSLQTVLSNQSHGVSQLLPDPTSWLAAGIKITEHLADRFTARGYEEVGAAQCRTVGVCSELLLNELALPGGNPARLKEVLETNLEEVCNVWSATDRNLLALGLSKLALAEEQVGERFAVALGLNKLSERVLGDERLPTDTTKRLEDKLFDAEVAGRQSFSEQGEATDRVKLQALHDQMIAEQTGSHHARVSGIASDIVKISGIESRNRLLRQSPDKIRSSVPAENKLLVADAIAALAEPYRGEREDKFDGVVIVEKALALDENNKKANLLLLRLASRFVREGVDEVKPFTQAGPARNVEQAWRLADRSVERLITGKLGDADSAGVSREVWSRTLKDACWICEGMHRISTDKDDNPSGKLNALGNLLLRLHGITDATRENLGEALKVLGKSSDRQMDADVQKNAAYGYYALGRACEMQSESAAAERYYSMSLKINPGKDQVLEARKRVKAGSMLESFLSSNPTQSGKVNGTAVDIKLPAPVREGIAELKAKFRTVVTGVAEECCAHVAAMSRDPKVAVPEFADHLRRKIDSWWELTDPAREVTPEIYVDYLAHAETVRKLESGELGDGAKLNGNLSGELEMLHDQIFASYQLSGRKGVVEKVVGVFKAINSRTLGL